MSTTTVLLTGASRGIGLGIVTILLETFHVKVVTISRSKSEELSALADKFPGDLTVLLGDVTEKSTHSQAVSVALEKYHRLDAVILNAGALELGKAASPDLGVEKWKAHFDVNFFSLLHTIHVAAPELRKSKGTLIFVSSGAANKGVAGWGPYSAGKAAMNSLARTLGVEEPEITTIAIRPGTVDTGMLVRIKGDEGGAVMDAGEYKRFQDLKLLSTDMPGYVIAGLAAKGAPKALSGQFVSWDGAELRDYQKA